MIWVSFALPIHQESWRSPRIIFTTQVLDKVTCEAQVKLLYHRVEIATETLICIRDKSGLRSVIRGMTPYSACLPRSMNHVGLALDIILRPPYYRSERGGIRTLDRLKSST